MKTKTKLIVLLAPLALYVVAAIIWLIVSLATNPLNNLGSGAGNAYYPEGDFEFVFSGTVTTDTGREFTLFLTGSDGSEDEEGDDAEQADGTRAAEGEAELIVSEMRALSVDGTWQYVENKGYKIYLEDANNTYMYSRYNEETKQFTVTFNCSLGNFGQPRAQLSYTDESFAEVYDGEGLGLKPPTFNLAGYNTYNHYSYGTLMFNEDNTLSVNVTNTGAGWYFSRVGFWEYDEDANVYTYWFTDNTISLTDGNMGIRGQEPDTYVNWTKNVYEGKTDEEGNPVIETEFNTHLDYDEFVNDYHLFTGEEYRHTTTFNEEDGTYYAEVEVQYNWGAGTGDIITFSGVALLADMEG